jgi:hypothetical protein
LKIYHKLLDPDKAVLLKVLGVICGVIFCIYSIPFFMALFPSVSLVVPIPHIAGKLLLLLFYLQSVILTSLAYGVSGFLMSLIVVFISRSREIKTVVFAAVIVAILSVVVKTEFISSSQPLFFKIYLLSDMILNVIFLFGFAVLGAWLLIRKNRLKMQEVKKDVQ